MTLDHRQTLSGIKRFDQLIAYLRDELGWPINQESFDELDHLFFEFTPEELGIDSKTAVKIETIRRLRPLSSKQPWGIYFVKFEQKKLPVVALRRILSQVALKKRLSANNPHRVAWSSNDLLFISNYGDGDARAITFAHFSQDKNKKDLPVLKVLGWDGGDTALHLDKVANDLTLKLSWPEDEDNLEVWQNQWKSAFTTNHGEAIATAKDLSHKLAIVAKKICEQIKVTLKFETNKGQLTQLYEAFKHSLMHNMDQSEFADMYAQTIVYGLLSVRISNPKKMTADDFANHLQTNPFLKELMQTFLQVGGRNSLSGLDFDELGISEIIEVLDNSNIEAVIRDFGNKNQDEDPVTHFYVDFLKEYDPQSKIQRGVFYTPRNLVVAAVKNIEQKLKIDFGLVDGLADISTWGDMASKNPEILIPNGMNSNVGFIKILDPAVGTGTFLVEVIDSIYSTLTTKWKNLGVKPSKIDELWNEYVNNYLLNRLYGYELQMAPYSIAHLKISLKLLETNYLFNKAGRARIYLTNTLDAPAEIDEATEKFLPCLGREANEVNNVKRNTRFTVILGNPPFHLHKDISISHKKKSGAKIGAPIEDVKLFELFISELNVFNADKDAKFYWDSAVYFLTWAIAQIKESSPGKNYPLIVSFILPRTIIASKFAAPIRRYLLQNCKKLSVLDLGGENRGALKEFNIFGIKKAVCLLTFTCGERSNRLLSYKKLDFIDFQDFSRKILSHEVLEELELGVKPVKENNYLFVGSSKTGYESFSPLLKMFDITLNGIQLKRLWPIALTKKILELRWSTLVKSPSSKRSALYVENNNQFSRKATLSSGKTIYSVSENDPMPKIIRIGYRSFDYQWMLLDPALAYSLRGKIYTAHKSDQFYLVGNLTKQASGDLFLTFSDAVVETDFHAKRGAKDVIPFFDDPKSNHVNLNSAFLDEFLLLNGFLPNNFHFYVLAVCSSKTFCNQFAKDTERYGLRVPIKCSLDLYEEIVAIGKNIATLNTIGNSQYGDKSFEELSPQHAFLLIKHRPISLPKKIKIDEDELKIIADDWEIAGVSRLVFDYSFSGYSPVKSASKYWQTSRSKARSELDTLFLDINESDLRRLLGTIHAIEGMIFIQEQLSHKIHLLLKNT